MPIKKEQTKQESFVIYVYDICVSASRLLNAILGGSAKETLCSRTGRYLITHKPRDNYGAWVAYYALHRITHVFERNHVFKAMHLADHRNSFIEKWDFSKHRK